jgi:glycine cleavage system H protein
MSKIPANLYYTEEHEWISVDGDVATIGISDFAQNSLGDIVFVELPEVGSQMEKDSTFGVVESIKSVSDLYVPVSGEVLEKNDEVESSPELINADAYAAWLIKVKMTDASQVKSLMDSAKYQDFCDSN